MYSRETELRHLHPKDIYNLSVKLDDNNCWKKLMEIIPKELNTSIDGIIDWEKATASGKKYDNDHVRLIENAIKRPGESRLYSQILFDEWSTSGKKQERPTVGVLLQLLVKSGLFRAADSVAVDFLNEPLPERPSHGPAARFDTTLPDEIFQDIEDVVNDTLFYPGTESLQYNANFANSLVDNNKDFYTKYQQEGKHMVMTNGVSDAPVPPPRNQRKARLLLNQQQQIQQQLLLEQQTQQATGNNASTAKAFNNIVWSNSQQSTSNSLPKFSQLMTKASTSNNSNNSTSTSTANYIVHTESTNLSEAPIPVLSVLGRSTAASSYATTQTNLDAEHSTTNTQEFLPVVSALNLNGERDKSIKNRVALGNCVEEHPNCGQESQTFSSSNFNSDNSYTFNEDDELPAVLAAHSIEEHRKSVQLNEESDNYNDDDDDDDEGADGDDDDDDDDDNSSVPNLSLFDQHSSNNDSSLTNVTGTSGENSFELSMNDCNSESNENIPCLSALKP